MIEAKSELDGGITGFELVLHVDGLLLDRPVARKGERGPTAGEIERQQPGLKGVVGGQAGMGALGGARQRRVA